MLNSASTSSIEDVSNIDNDFVHDRPNAFYGQTLSKARAILHQAEGLRNQDLDAISIVRPFYLLPFIFHSTTTTTASFVRQDNDEYP